ncbi:MAG: acylneuraminate cytidylyltransferase family protein [Polyangiaceae bacterium]|nr:acylneuraminate cytidylyltransferase family protein [Polyangiaceae bacterium]
MLFHSIIPARGGSKGLPKKNILPLLEKPLIQYTIESSLHSRLIATTTVSSDSEEILDIAHHSRAKSLKRPASLATDTASSDAVIQHFIDSQNLSDSDAILLLQPTSPLRTAQHIIEAIQLFESSGQTVISMKAADECPFKGFRVEQGTAIGYFGKHAPFSRRQDFPELFYANGAIYIFRVADFKEEGCIPRQSIAPFLMDQVSSVDIDSIEDLKLAEFLMEKKNAE